MSVQEMGVAAIPEEAAKSSRTDRVITLSTIIGAVSITIFVATQAFAVALMTAWAISGALGAGPRSSLVLYGAAIVCALIATAVTWRFAWDAETRAENNT